MTYHDHVPHHNFTPFTSPNSCCASGFVEEKKEFFTQKKMDPNIKAEHGQNGTYNKQKWMNVRLWSGGLDGAAGGDESRNQQHMNKMHQVYVS